MANGPPRYHRVPRFTRGERRAIGSIGYSIGASAIRTARGKSERGTATGRTLKKYVRHNIGKGRRGTTTGVAVSETIDNAKLQIRKAEIRVRRTVARVRKRLR